VLEVGAAKLNAVVEAAGFAPNNPPPTEGAACAAPNAKLGCVVDIAPNMDGFAWAPNRPPPMA